MSDRRGRGELSKPVERLLAELSVYGSAHLRATKWVIPETGSGFQHATIEAAYERCLVSIIYESKHKRRQICQLTEIGDLAAEGVIARARIKRRQITEAAALLIQELIE